MRPEKDTRVDHIVKEEMLDKIIADGYDPFLVIDDRPSVVAMWRRRGLTCLQNEYRDDGFDFAPAKRTTLTLMVGPSGAGKSDWLSQQRNRISFKIHASHIISTGQLRSDLLGDFRDQKGNDAVFSALQALVKVRLGKGLPVVVDATNLRGRDRKSLVKLAPPGTRLRYIVVNRSMEEKYADAAWRKGLPFDLIAKHEQIFNDNLQNILKGDGIEGVVVIDARQKERSVSPSTTNQDD
jgi:predicted kinase